MHSLLENGFKPYGWTFLFNYKVVETIQNLNSRIKQMQKELETENNDLLDSRSKMEEIL